jgi:hypothetical protein
MKRVRRTRFALRPLPLDILHDHESWPCLEERRGIPLPFDIECQLLASATGSSGSGSASQVDALTAASDWLRSLGFDGAPTSSMQNTFFVYFGTNGGLVG